MIRPSGSTPVTRPGKLQKRNIQPGHRHQPDQADNADDAAAGMDRSTRGLSPFASIITDICLPLLLIVMMDVFTLYNGSRNCDIEGDGEYHRYIRYKDGTLSSDYTGNTTRQVQEMDDAVV